MDSNFLCEDLIIFSPTGVQRSVVSLLSKALQNVLQMMGGIILLADFHDDDFYLKLNK